MTFKKKEKKNKQTPPNSNQIKEDKTKQTMESIICWLTTPEHQACLEWLVFPVSFYWRKLIFLLPYGISDS